MNDERATNANLRAAAAAECPRCGYDLQGEVATWADACPLAGRCNECGLELAWSELLAPGREPPPWYIECRGRFRRLPLQIGATAAHALAPWRLWRAVRMTHRIRWGRIAILLVAMLVATSLAIGLGSAATVFRLAAFEARFAAQFAAQLGPIATWSNNYDLRTIQFDDLGIADLPTSPFAPGCDWTTARSAAIVLVAPWLPVTLPLSASSGSTVTPSPLGTPGGDALLAVGGIAVGAQSCTALTFLALPTTRRRCRVRMPHVWRIATTGLVAWFPMIVAVQITVWTEWELGPWVALLLLTAPLGWWWAATRLYLRMPHAFAVAFLSLVVGVLAAPILPAAVWSLLRH